MFGSRKAGGAIRKAPGLDPARFSQEQAVHIREGHEKRFLLTPVRTWPFMLGVLFSLVGHLFGVVFFIFIMERASAGLVPPQQVFTVTLEGGEKLGGISQVPTNNSKRPKALPSHPDEAAEEVTSRAAKQKELKLEEPSAVDDPEAILKKQRAEAEKLRLAEEKKKQQEIEKKKAAEEEKKRAEEAKKQAEEEKKRQKQQEEEERAKAEEEKRKAADEKKKAEDDRKARERELTAKANRDALLDRAVKKAQKYTGESANAGGEGFGAAALGGKGMGGGTLASAEYIAYYNALERHVKGGWRWLSGSEGLTAQVTVTILPDGTVQNATISKSSGNSSFDDSILRAVYKASPVPAAPEALYAQFREVKFTFDSRK